MLWLTVLNAALRSIDKNEAFQKSVFKQIQNLNKSSLNAEVWSTFWVYIVYCCSSLERVKLLKKHFS